MASNRFFTPSKANRTPEQRRKLRAQLETAPISSTTVDQPKTLSVDSTDKDLAKNLKTQDLAQQPIPPRVQVTVSLALQIGIGVVIFLGAVVAVIVYMSTLSAGIATNKTNIDNIQQAIKTQDARIDTSYDRAIKYIDKQIDNLRDLIKTR
jgi:hypothetical protein